MKIAIIAGNSMGGTEKAAFTYACELARRGHQVDAVTDHYGCRSGMLNAAGVRINSISLTADGFTSYLKEFKPDILHNHTSGYADHSQLYTALRSLGTDKPKLIETNVFGQLMDLHDRNDVDMRLFVTFTSGMQAFARNRVINGPPVTRRDTVVFNPLPDDAFSFCQSKRTEFRKHHGVLDNEILAIRIGRPGNKWKAWECTAFQVARKSNPKLRLFLMEPKESLRKRIEAGKFGEGIIVQQATADPDYLQSVYSAGDIMFQASSFGESYGYTLAEGMAIGMPIITLSTPWGDDAQTELVKHGETGYVCRTIKGLAMALHELSLDQDKIKRFGEAGRERIRSKSSLQHETDLLESIFNFLIYAKSNHLMEDRFEHWMRFIKSKTGNTNVDCYEQDHRLNLLIMYSILYNNFWRMKQFVKYLLMKAKGFPINPLK